MRPARMESSRKDDVFLSELKRSGGGVMGKILSTRSYGICVFSLEVLQDFLKKKRGSNQKTPGEISKE